MLKVFRDNLKNLAWILWVIIALFVLALAADFGASVRRGSKATAATVGGEAISLAEFQREFQVQSNYYRQALGDQFTPDMEKRVAGQALEKLVDDRILLREARRLGLTVTDAELQEQILKDPVFQDENGRFIGEEEYVQRIQGARMNVEDFEQQQRDQILLRKLAQVLYANVYVSEDEVQQAYRNQVERAKIRYLQIPRARFASEVQVQPSELAAYFGSHKQEFRLPEQREAAYLLADRFRMADQVKPADPELRSWYAAHQADLTSEEQVKARHILVMVNDKRSDEQARQRIDEAKKRIQGGADFAAVAREISEDPASKGSGGDLGYFGRGKMVKEFEEAAFNARPGALVGPVKSSFGYHLLEVTDKRPGGLRPFEEVKEQIRARLTAEKAGQLAEDAAKALANRLAKDKPRGPEDLRALAQQTPGVTFAETGRFGAQDAVPGFGPNSAFSATAFSLKKGEVSQAIQAPQGWAVLYVKDVHAAHIPELAEVEPRVRMAVVGQKLQQMAQGKLAEARRQMAQGKTLDQVAADLGLPVKETAEFGGQGAIPGLGYNPELVKAALSLQTGQTGGPIADAQGALLFQVTDHKGWDPKQYAANREQTRAQLLQQKANLLGTALVAQRKRDLGVEYDRQFLEQFGLVPEQG